MRFRIETSLILTQIKFVSNFCNGKKMFLKQRRKVYDNLKKNCLKLFFFLFKFKDVTWEL